jgi:hypothetical protein
VFGRELIQGVALGFTLAFFGFLRATWSGDGGRFAVLIATTVVGLVVIGCVVGAMLPIVLYALKQDPATTSTPSSRPSSTRWGFCFTWPSRDGSWQTFWPGRRTQLTSRGAKRNLVTVRWPS